MESIGASVIALDADAGLIRALEGMLEKARAGELHGIAAVTLVDGEPFTSIVGDANVALVGAIEILRGRVVTKIERASDGL
jgi:glycerol-3-phosphate responsive antiterminator